MSSTSTTVEAPKLRVGSLFSGYGGLDLAVEQVFDARTVWFSEINTPVAGVFAHHWPTAQALGDITLVDWSTVEPVDVLIGGFPCQSVSVMGRRHGLVPGAASGLWAHMAHAIEALQPAWVVIENVRGLLTTKARNTDLEGEPGDDLRDDATRPGATPAATSNGATRADASRADAARAVGDGGAHLGDGWHPATPGGCDIAGGAVRALDGLGGVGVDAAGSATAGATVVGTLAALRYDAGWVGVPASLVGAAHHRWRFFLLAWPQPRDGGPGAGVVAHPVGGGLRTGHGADRQGQGAQGDDHVDASTRPTVGREPGHTIPGWGPNLPREGHLQPHGDDDVTRRWGRFAPAITRWEAVMGYPAPVGVVRTAAGAIKPNPVFVEWLMGLPIGWVTDPSFGLSLAQQLTALGNGVVPAQAVHALRHLLAQCAPLTSG
jgi:DNA (cytosine-5)-methyltransferase 1